MEFTTHTNGPIKSNDMQYMYNYCKKMISNANNPSELLSIINILIPLEKLKTKLIEIIDNLYLNRPQLSPGINKSLTSLSPFNQLKKLYLNSSSVTEIFPDHVLVNIIQYLPSEQFSRLPVLSSDFHNIMIKYPILYQQYKVVIDEIPMHCTAQRIKLLINHSKKSIYIKLAEYEVDSVGLEAAASINSLMFTASFDSKWGGLIPNFSMGQMAGPKSGGIRILNPFSVSFPWYMVPKWILFGDKWARNTLNNSANIPFTPPRNIDAFLSLDINNTSDSDRLSCNMSYDNNIKQKQTMAHDIWKMAAPNITTLELENSQKHFIAQLPAEFHKLNHLKFTGTLSDSPVKYITPSRFPQLLYLEFHKIEIDSMSSAMGQFLQKEKQRYEHIRDIHLPTDDEMNEFIGIRARMNYRYKIINDILSCFKHLMVFKYYDDGCTINSVEMDLSEWNNNRLMNNPHNDVDEAKDNTNLNHNLHISSAIPHVQYINKLRQINGCIVFPESLEFISIINCDCKLDFSLCRNIIGLHLYGVNHQQIHKWPLHNIVHCLVCSTQTEMTEDWNDIFETAKYRLNHKHNMLPGVPPRMATLYSLQTISPMASSSFEHLPVRFMKRITNRTLSPVEPRKNGYASDDGTDIISPNASTALQRSMSSKALSRTVSKPVHVIAPMSRIKSAGSNSSSSHSQLTRDEVVVPPPKVYVENKLNKTKSLNLWNNNIMEDMMIIGEDMHEMDGLDGCAFTDMDKNISFPDNANDDASLQQQNSNGSGSASAFNSLVLPLDINVLASKVSKQRSYVFDVFEEYKKMECMVNNKDKELMCMEIEDEGEIFYRLMNTVFADKPDLLKNKIEIYENWWQLKVAQWIKHIGKQILPKAQRNII
eukprot:15961_1